MFLYPMYNVLVCSTSFKIKIKYYYLTLEIKQFMVTMWVTVHVNWGAIITSWDVTWKFSLCNPIMGKLLGRGCMSGDEVKCFFRSVWLLNYCKHMDSTLFCCVKQVYLERTLVTNIYCLHEQFGFCSKE